MLVVVVVVIVLLLLLLVMLFVVVDVVVLLLVVFVLLMVMAVVVVVVAVLLVLVFVEVVVLLDVGIKCGSPRSILPSFHRSASFSLQLVLKYLSRVIRHQFPHPNPTRGGGGEEKYLTESYTKKGHSEFLTFFAHGRFKKKERKTASRMERQGRDS